MNRTRRLPWFAVAASLLLIATSGCRQTQERALFSLPVPDSWAEQLESDRRMRDDMFISSSSSPLLDEDRPTFKGLDYYEADPDWYFAGEIEAVPPQKLTMTFTDGEREEVTRVGRIRFPIDGRLHQLYVYKLNATASGPESLFLPFADQSSGLETYAAGRYLDIVGPPGGPFVFDFNRAYNPLCAYGGPYGCPVTPPENRLDARVTAGERGFKIES